MRTKKTSVLFLFFLLGIVTSCADNNTGTKSAFQNSTDSDVLQEPIPSSFFGLHIHRAAPTDRFPQTSIWPNSEFGSWRLWDAMVSWPYLERAPSAWNFVLLDNLVSLAKKRNVEIILPLGLTPGWASARPYESSAYAPGNAAEPVDIENWKKYVQAVVTRYKGDIHHYEIWNEPNLKKFYSGNMEQMLTLAREAYLIIKEIDPSAVVVSPSPTGSSGPDWLEEYLSKGGGNYADVIGYHFYVSPKAPEEMIATFDNIQKIMAKHKISNKPLWNTETGWFIQNGDNSVIPEQGIKGKVLSVDEASAYIARAHILSWAHRVTKLYWYAWDNTEMGLVEPDAQVLKKPAIAYSLLINWLAGAKLVHCTENSSMTWHCLLQRNDKAFYILWNVNGETYFKIPADWDVNTISNLDGNIADIVSRRIVIDKSPLKLENTP